ncbi:carbonic anhydrase [Bifidobacterium pullorum]|nr:carbonic anhydrase [Bifidobacterium pullorum]
MTEPLADDAQENGANAVWSRMLAGNRRFAEGKPEHPWQDAETRETLLDAQRPEAAVLACSDSRVPPEIVFDQGLGDLFTVRTAGQMLDDAVVASLEYAVTTLGARLLVVMGHENCGAVRAAAAEFDALLERTTAEAEGSLETAEVMDSLDERILEAATPFLRHVGLSVWQAREAELESPEDMERVHVARTIEELVTRSETIQQALATDRLMIVGARYRLSDGKVEVLSF